ncbi:hypothetical protein ACNHIQ_26025 [Klebsiella pneumoniae]|uniref:hypothetical protein n=1 Tax=Klebsiella pneumoniae TaxID=573 RepID=UPI00403F1A70
MATKKLLRKSERRAGIVSYMPPGKEVFEESNIRKPIKTSHAAALLNKSDFG